MTDDPLDAPPDAPPTCERHPERPAAITCSHCGSFACAECDTIHQGRHVCSSCMEDGRIQAEGIPWARRQELGLLPAAWQTVLELSSDPATFFDRVKNAPPDLKEAMFFAFLVAIPGGIMGAILNATIFGAVLAPGNLGWLSDLGPEAGEALAAMRAGWATQAILGVVTTPFLIVTVHLMLGLMHHLILFLVGGIKRPVDATLHVSIYSLGVNLWAAIPLLGWFVGFWITLCKVIGYSRVHDTEWWRALMAVLAPWCLACGSVFGLILVVAGAGAVFGF